MEMGMGQELLCSAVCTAGMKMFPPIKNSNQRLHGWMTKGNQHLIPPLPWAAYSNTWPSFWWRNFFLISSLNFPGTTSGYGELEGLRERDSLRSWITLFLVQMTGVSKLNAFLRALTVVGKLPSSKTRWYVSCSARAVPGETCGPKMKSR